MDKSDGIVGTQHSSRYSDAPMARNGIKVESSTGDEFRAVGTLESTPISQTTSLLDSLKGRLRSQLTTSSKLFKSKSLGHWVLLIISCLAMMTAFPASSILTRLYYVDGGTSKWLITWLAAAGWPISAACLLVFCIVQKEHPSRLSWVSTIWYIVLGLLSAADNLVFAYAYAYLPASSAALLSSSSLAFTAIFAYFLVKQKFNSSSVNAIVVMTTATVILGLDSNSDRPYGVTKNQYATGFVLAIVGSAGHGLIFAMSERFFISVVGRNSFRLALELQTATSMFAMIFTTIGILIAGDFGKVHAEAERFRHGPGSYYEVFVWAAVTFQLGILGSVGCLYLASTLLAGVLNAARVPATAIVAVLVFNDPMGGYKILAIVLSVWSFGTYMWGSYQQQRRREQKLPSSPISSSGSLGSRNFV